MNTPLENVQSFLYPTVVLLRPGGVSLSERSCCCSTLPLPATSTDSTRDRPKKMAATDRSRSEAAKQRRQDQLQRWLGSETDQTGPGTRDGSTGTGTRRARVRFAQGAVFMAACSAGDREEVAVLLRQGADINHANIDGLTALHQMKKWKTFSFLTAAAAPFPQ
uniref:protein phosphatase 1 regulatory subunit 12B-like n=1 Tax=Oncorhynchus gorbuscha TaxID=8017 RepID=UPI001EAF80ED|nr:protein phosphatase 1 regulatory subunit 12B-like [Oncorhynchus gorbuscha]